MSFDRQLVHDSPTGAKLHVNSRRADGRARGVVQVNHGLAEHSARYARFAEFLAGKGFATYAHDHRGHGYTKAPDAPLGRFSDKDGGDKVIADVASIHDLIASEYPGVPVVVMGHSMGGMITGNFLHKHSERVVAGSIWNSDLTGGLLARAATGILAVERMRLGSDVPSRILPKMTFQAWGKAVPNHKTLFDWLSHDEAEVAKYVEDPLCGWDASVSMWRDVFGFILAGAEESRYATMRRDLPMYLIGGDEDPATNKGKAIETLAARMRAMGFSNLQSKVYAKTRHETLNEVNREQAMAEFGVWLDRVVPVA